MNPTPFLSPTEIMVAQRNRADALARRPMDRVAHRRRHQRHHFLADSRDPAIGLDEVEIYVARIIAHPHRFILVEIALLDGRVFERDLLTEYRPQSPRHHAADLPFGRFGIYQRMSAIMDDIHAV